MRSVIKQANPAGIQNIVRQQFEWAGQIIGAGLVPIIEPEVDIHCPEKSKAEELLKAGILARLNELPASQLVMLKLTLPDPSRPLRRFHPSSQGRARRGPVGWLFAERSQRSAAPESRRRGQLFPRLVEGLTAQQTDADYDAVLDASIQSIYEASIT